MIDGLGLAGFQGEGFAAGQWKAGLLDFVRGRGWGARAAFVRALGKARGHCGEVAPTSRKRYLAPANPQTLQRLAVKEPALPSPHVVDGASAEGAGRRGSTFNNGRVRAGRLHKSQVVAE